MPIMMMLGPWFRLHHKHRCVDRSLGIHNKLSPKAFLFRLVSVCCQVFCPSHSRVFSLSHHPAAPPPFASITIRPRPTDKFIFSVLLVSNYSQRQAPCFCPRHANNSCRHVAHCNDSFCFLSLISFFNFFCCHFANLSDNESLRRD